MPPCGSSGHTWGLEAGHDSTAGVWGLCVFFSAALSNLLLVCEEEKNTKQNWWPQATESSNDVNIPHLLVLALQFSFLLTSPSVFSSPFSALFFSTDCTAPSLLSSL